MPITDVEVKQVAPQRILSLQVTAPRDAEQDVEALFERVIEHIEAAGADRASPISWRQLGDEITHIHAGYVAPTDEVPGFEAVILPGVSVASVVRRGAVDGMGEAHEVLARWAEQHGHVASIERGHWRELYLETDDNDYSDWLIEVQLELIDRGAKA